MIRPLLFVLPFALAACDPAELADKAVRRTAETVVMPVVNLDMPAGPAQAATACILDAASPDELRLWPAMSAWRPERRPRPRSAASPCAPQRKPALRRKACHHWSAGRHMRSQVMSLSRKSRE
jgi:hypothetical protein